LAQCLEQAQPQLTLNHHQEWLLAEELD